MPLAAPSALTAALRRCMPIVVGLREYLPDVLLGLTNGFGGTAAGPYDANGAYARIGAVGGQFSLAGAATLVPQPGLGFSAGNVRRCPGAATQVAPDRSNAVEPSTPCDPEHRP